MDIEDEVSQIVAWQEFEQAMADFIEAMDRLSLNMRELREAVDDKM